MKQNFKFNPEKGWEKVGNSEVTNQKTEYALGGKSFELSSITYLDASSSVSDSITLSFKDTKNSDGQVADYVISHPLPATASKDSRSVNLSGQATGSITHSFGANSFNIELNDKEQQVTFSGNSSNPKEIAGVGKMSTMSLSVKTNANSYESKYTTTKYSAYGTFVEMKRSKT